MELAVQVGDRPPGVVDPAHGGAAVPVAHLRAERPGHLPALLRDLYWRHLSGERYFCHELSRDSSSLVRWRRPIGWVDCEWLLAHSIVAERNAGVIKAKSLKAVVVDTAVQPEAIAHPTDSRLLNRARDQLVAAVQTAGIALRQSYGCVGKAAEGQA